MKEIVEYLLSKTNNKAISDIDWMNALDGEWPDDKKPRCSKDGKPYLWWKAYVLLKTEGPMSKGETLRKLGLKETSYSAEFAKISNMNIIVPNKSTRKLEPIDPSKWKLNKTAR